MRYPIYFAVFLVALSLTEQLQAAEYDYDCTTCDYQSEASLFAELKGHGYTEGYHTVLVANMTIPNAWQVDIYVQDNAPDPFFQIGTKTVTVLTITNAPTSAVNGLQAWKDIGITQIFQDIDVDFFIDLSNDGAVISECGSAGAACASVSSAIAAQPESALFSSGLTNLWSALAVHYNVKPRWLVIFPDLSVEVYEFVAIGGGGNSYMPVSNTATDSNGNAAAGGTFGLAGWADFFGSSSTIESQWGSGSGLNCTTGISRVVDEQGNTVSITRTSNCEYQG